MSYSIASTTFRPAKSRRSPKRQGQMDLGEPVACSEASRHPCQVLVFPNGAGEEEKKAKYDAYSIGRTNFELMILWLWDALGSKPEGVG